MSPPPQETQQLDRSPSPDPPPSTQLALPTLTQVSHKATGKLTAIPCGKMVKKTAVNRFADSRESETQHLNLKWKMEHEEKMALMNLKKHKYELWYAAASSPTTSTSNAGSRTLEPTVTGATKQDKEIQILLLQIKLAEIKRDTAASASASTFQSHLSSPFYSDGSSTPSGTYSAPGPQDLISENYGMVKQLEPHPAGDWQDLFKFLE